MLNASSSPEPERTSRPYGLIHLESVPFDTHISITVWAGPNRIDELSRNFDDVRAARAYYAQIRDLAEQNLTPVEIVDQVRLAPMYAQWAAEAVLENAAAAEVIAEAEAITVEAGARTFDDVKTDLAGFASSPQVRRRRAVVRGKYSPAQLRLRKRMAENNGRITRGKGASIAQLEGLAAKGDVYLEKVQVSASVFRTTGATLTAQGWKAEGYDRRGEQQVRDDLAEAMRRHNSRAIARLNAELDTYSTPADDTLAADVLATLTSPAPMETPPRARGDVGQHPVLMFSDATPDAAELDAMAADTALLMVVGTDDEIRAELGLPDSVSPQAIQQFRAMYVRSDNPR
ncbi:hypothetical protein [Polymorphospora rubra]|uniref:Uncharacterized protein n=1 Tax=Polymorphospora rubra TaxID=338584 RepID=A0A810MVM3_9ACTN|nr:hypothetical protein [Polymorphospora rubra]BCJ65072.1 hypothetical protein Prubr_20930 [Polymorphospora rubra]